jgi:hypothetical protein
MVHAMVKIGMFSILISTGLWAEMSLQALKGIWYEEAYGEQTVWLDGDGRCQFVRGKHRLFDRSTCHWNTRGEMILDYHGAQSKIYMRLSGETLMLAKTPVLLSRYTAEALLQKCQDPLALSAKNQQPLLGEWEAQDHSMQLSLLSGNRCHYRKQEDPALSRAKCSWSAGKKGATLIFVNPENPERNTALFAHLSEGKLLLDPDKSNLLRHHAKMELVRSSHTASGSK